MPEIVSLTWNNTAISQRKSDSFVNLTQMCKAGGKKINDYFRLKETKAYIAHLSIDTGIPVSDLYSLKKGGDSQSQGTWGHPLLALNLARWISPSFAVWADAHIFVLMSTGSTSLDIDPISKTKEIIEERYQELNTLLFNDERFLDCSDYSNWSSGD